MNAAFVEDFELENTVYIANSLASKGVTGASVNDIDVSVLTQELLFDRRL